MIQRWQQASVLSIELLWRHLVTVSVLLLS